MIDVSRCVLDSRFSQTITVKRTTGAWKAGRFVADSTSPTTITMIGTITIANAKQIEFIPEGDRVGGEIAIYTTKPLYNSRSADGTNKAGISDIITYHNEDYKIYQSNEWNDYGFYSAIGQRMRSD